MLHQKDTLKQYEISMSDLDFCRLYPDFSRNEKALYDIFPT